MSGIVRTGNPRYWAAHDAVMELDYWALHKVKKLVERRILLKDVELAQEAETKYRREKQLSENTRNEDDQRVLHDALILLRRQAGNPSLRQIGEAAGVSHTHVADIFNGKQKYPGWSKLQGIVAALNGDLDYFGFLLNKAIQSSPLRPR